MNHQPFRTAAVLGAGVMGSQIAAQLSNAGLTVHLLDLSGNGDGKNEIVKKAFERARNSSPNPFFTRKSEQRIILGNFDENFDRIADSDWVIEAVVEHKDVKQRLMKRLEETVQPNTIFSTNTSSIPIHLIAKNCSMDFKNRFLGTHFFNPPRNLKLLEIIPTQDTDPAIVERISLFARLHLGKGIVVAKDVPAFIGNRVGIFAILHAIRALGDYTIEEIDTLTGSLSGRPVSATFRTVDLIGIDTLSTIAKYLYNAVPKDDNREIFLLPNILDALLEMDYTGAKTGRGFYRKEGNSILPINPKTFKYLPPEAPNLNLGRILKYRTLSDRLCALYAHTGRAGAFFHAHILAHLSYCAHRIPEITTNPAEIDRALCWGFGWKVGPFKIWDILGFKTILSDMETKNISVPDWIEQMAQEGNTTFYIDEGINRKIYLPIEGYTPDAIPSDEIQLTTIHSRKESLIWKNEESTLLDLGEDVALFEFQSKANTLGTLIVSGLLEVIDLIEKSNFRGLVIGNTGKHFSVGANLAEIANLKGRFNQLEQLILNFQAMIQRVHYAGKPIVVATQGQVLGGGCELALASTQPVAATESYIGLVELGVGLIPGGGGTMRMASLAHERAPTNLENHIQPYLFQAWDMISLATVSGNAYQGREMGLLPPQTRIVSNTDRRLYVAKEEVIRLSNEGYTPPAVQNAIKVLGSPGRAQFEVTAYSKFQAGFFTEYDRYLSNRLAYVLTGGALTSPAFVHENYLLDLEREVFLSLLGEEKTRDRIDSILQTNKPLRN